jgi:hypothetical protein
MFFIVIVHLLYFSFFCGYVSDLSEPLRSFISVFFSVIKMIMRLYGRLEGENTVRFSKA